MSAAVAAFTPAVAERISELLSEFKLPTLHAELVARFQRDYNGKQPGDPAKAAQVILRVAGMEDPPLRLLLGTDAVRAAEEASRARAEADEKWRALSVSTDFPTS